MCEVYCIHFLYPDLYRSSAGTHPKPTHVQLGNVHKYICKLYNSFKKNTIHMYSLIQYTVQTAGYYITQIQYNVRFIT